jgi:two-component system chemotaxis sensor kinase CheA
VGQGLVNGSSAVGEQQIGREIGEALAAVDPGDLTALAALHTRCAEAGAGAEPELAAILGRAAEVLEGVVLAELADPAAALARLALELGAEVAEDSFNASAVLDEISGAMLLVEPADLPALAGLHTRFEQIAAWAEDQAEHDVRRAAEEAAALLEAVVLEEVSDPVAALAQLFAKVDAMQAVVRDGRASYEVFGEAAAADLIEVEVQAPTEVAAAPAAPAAPRPLEADDSLLADFVTEAREHLDAADVNLLTIETDPAEEEALNAVFRAFHTIKGVAGFLALPDIQRLSHEAESLLDQARKHAVVLEGQTIGVVFEAVDLLKALVEAVAAARAGDRLLWPEPAVDNLVPRLRLASNTSGGSRLGDLLLAAGAVSPDALQAALAAQQSGEGLKLGEHLVHGGAPVRTVAAALETQKRSGAGTGRATGVSEAVRVDPERLDRLVDAIGELVIAESMVSQSSTVKRFEDAGLQRHLGQLDKIVRELQEMATSLRMVPVRATFQKMARLVRDLAVKCGKEVEFVSSGDDTELDRSVVERIGDPLMHMVRNAIDHGIEADAAARAAADKPARARVELRAFHQGGNIHIEIADDGRGLDREAIVRKAIERGLVRESEILSDQAVYALIFEPGFSTATQITDVSGRGVGMDVVKRNIEALRGTVEIRSERGRGSTFTIRLPLTLAVIDGMVLRVGRERYVLPTLSIVSSMQPRPETLSTVLGRGEMLTVQGRQLSLYRLADLFGLADAEREATAALAVVVESGGQQFALLVDELLGQQQIVIKSLGESLRNLPGLTGGAIMPDGRVGLILDVNGLGRLARGELLADAA